MEIKVIDGYITGFATVGGFPDGIEIEDGVLETLEQDKLTCYRYENGTIIFDEEKYNSKVKVEKLQELRARRELECFSIVNRGQAWYDLLSEDQRIELSNWYQAWLNVTETMVVPEKPLWIKS